MHFPATQQHPFSLYERKCATAKHVRAHGHFAGLSPGCRTTLSSDSQPDVAQSRLQLSLVTRHVLRVVLDLLGVDAPEVMEEKVQ